MITPKEKAKELVDKFINIDIEYNDSLEGNCFMTMTKLNAKECALIAVDEMIAFVKHAFSYINIELATPSIVYLEEVKQEIEKL